MSLMMALQRVTEDTGPVRLVPVEGYVQELGRRRTFGRIVFHK